MPPRLPLVVVLVLSLGLSACAGPQPEPGAATGAGATTGSGVAATSATPAAPGGTAAGERSVDATSLAPAAEPTALRWREVTVPAGTTLRVRLANDLASDTSRVEDPVKATLAAPILVRGEEVVPSGAALRGEVSAVARSGKVKGRASLAFRFDTLTMDGEDYDASTERVSRIARATKGRDAQKIGLGAGAGALIGAIAGGGKGAAIGSAVGAGAGGGVVAATRGEEVRLPAGTSVTTKLSAPLTVRVPSR